MNADVAIVLSVAALVITVLAWVRFVLAEELTESKSTALSTICLLYTSPSPRDVEESRMPSSA